MAYTIEVAKAFPKHDNINIGQRILIVGEDFNLFRLAGARRKVLWKRPYHRTTAMSPF